MTIIDLLSVLNSRRLLLSGILVTIVSAGMIVTLLLPPAYQSTMKILVTRDRIDPRVTPAEKNAETSRADMTEEEFNSEIEILQSRAVIEGVVRQLGLDKQYAGAPEGRLANLRARLANFYRSFHEQAAPDAMERAVTNLTERLEAVSIKKSRIINATYSDSNPERAAQVLDELYRQYAEHHLRLLQNSKAGNVFREQGEAFSQKLNDATESLKRFDARNGVAGKTTQRELLLQQFYQAQGDLDKARTEIRETGQRIATLKTQIESQPERIESEARTKYVAARDKIKDEILTLELQRTQLLQKYQPNSRLVKDVEERLAQSRELLAREEQSPPQERTTVLNDVHRRLSGELLSAQANLTSLREREQSLAKLTEQYKSQAAWFGQKSFERDDLERMRGVNEEAYLLYRKKAQEADIVNALNLERIVNFSMAEQPGVNHKPVSPKPLINLAVLLVVGLMAAIAIVAFLERNRLLPDKANLLAAIRDGSFPPADGKRGLSLHLATLLLSGDQSGRNDRQFPASGENALSLPEQTTSTSDFDKAMDDAFTSDSDSTVAQNGKRRFRVTKAFPSEPDSSDAQLQKQSSQNDVVGGKPEAWRVEAVVEYLYHVHRLPPGKLSETLRETVGWEIHPAELDEILSRVAKRQPPLNDRRQREDIASALDSQSDEITRLLLRD